jgi:hypothetical protein
MKNSISFKILLIAVALPLFAGCASQAPTSVAPQVATADNINIGQPTQPPPENQKDVIPVCPGPRTLPHPGDIWIPGRWVQQGNVYVWQTGHWRSGAPADEESTDR